MATQIKTKQAGIIDSQNQQKPSWVEVGTTAGDNTFAIQDVATAARLVLRNDAAAGTDVVLIEGLSAEFDVRTSGRNVILTRENENGGKQTITINLANATKSVQQTAQLVFMDGSIMIGNKADSASVLVDGDAAKKAISLGDPKFTIADLTTDQLTSLETAFGAVSVEENLTLTSSVAATQEGNTVFFNVDTQNIAAGSTFSYTLTGVHADDVVGGQLAGVVTLDSKGKAVVAVTLANDMVTDGAETLTLNVNGKSASVTVADTSLTPTERTSLTIMSDERIGTAGNDLFKGRIGTNADGLEANTLNSGDVIDGMGGTDELYAQVFTGGTAANGSAIRPIQPEITDVEIIKLEAQHRDLGASDDDVHVSAMEIQGADQLWSYNSTADLVIQNATTKDADGTVRDTSELTIGMAYTGNSDHQWDEADYRVYFDQDYLTPGKETGRAAVDVEAMNEDAYDAGQPPLSGVYFSQFDLTVNGAEFSLVPFLGESATGNGSEIQTYDDLLAKVQAALTQLKAANPTNAAIQTLEAELGPQFTSDESRVGTSIRLTIAGETGGVKNTLSIVPADLQLSRAPTSTIPNNNRYERANNDPAIERETPVEINVVLEKVGLSGDGGELVIGSMNKGEDSNSLNDNVNTYNDTREGFEKFNVTVLGDASKPSSLSSLRSTNNTLETVIVASQARQDNSYADLIIGNGNSSQQSIGNDDHGIGLKDVRTFDATAFKGNLSLGAELTDESIAKYLDLVDTQGNPSADNMLFSYKGGVGNDEIQLLIDGDTAAHEDFALTIDSGAGNDYVHTYISPIGGEDGANNNLENQAYLGNLTINAGDGNDEVWTEGSGNFIINAGSGNDVVYTDGNDAGSLATWRFNQIFNNTPIPSDQGLPTSGIFIANGKLTVSFSPEFGVETTDGFTNGANGYEVTVDLPTGPGFVVTNGNINQAIKNAVNNDPILNNLLEVVDGENNMIEFRSLIDGGYSSTDAEAIRIAISAPTVTVSDTAVLAAWKSFSHDSTDTIADINSYYGTTLDLVDAFDDGAVDVTMPEDTDTILSREFSPEIVDRGADGNYESDNVIDLGTGDDVLVLGTGSDLPNEGSFTFGIYNNGTSNDTIVLNGSAFGNDTIVNFVVGSDAEFSGDNGQDYLDFTSYLTSQQRASGSSSNESKTLIPVTLDNSHHAEAITTVMDSATGSAPLVAAGDITLDGNEVVVLTFGNDLEAAGTADNETWEGLSAAVLQGLINNTAPSPSIYGGDNTYGNIQFGGIRANDELTEPTTVGGSGSGKSIIMVENGMNRGEYKVFEVSWNLVSGDTDSPGVANGQTTVNLLGTLDFGDTLAGITEVNLVGSEDHAAMFTLVGPL